MDQNSERTLTENDLVGVGNEVSQIENGCVFRLLKVDENVNADNITTLEMKSLNLEINVKSQAKRPSNFDNINESSSKKLKTNLNGENDNNELPSTSKSDENKIETNGIKIEAVDENSVDIMFSENPIENHQIKTENITIISLLNSDEEENAYIDNNYVPPNNDNDYIIISSDDEDEEEDNPWLERLSQRSNYSPPPLADSWAEKEVNNEWWPKLSQSFLDEINQVIH